MSIIKEIREEIDSVYKEPSSRELTILALIFLVIPGVIGGYLTFGKHSPNGYIWMVAGAVLCLARLVPPLFRAIYRLWIQLSVILGFFVSRILLTIIFFLAITPTALIMKVVGKDPMDRKLDPNAPTYWIRRTEGEDRSVERYERQF